MKLSVLLACLTLVGCARRAARIEIPATCMHIDVRDFRKPCLQLKSGDLICDDVLVHVNCIRPTGQKGGNN